MGTVSMSALSAQGIARPAERAFCSVLVDFRGSENQRGEFLALRSATQGSALRTRSLSRKAGESFIIGAAITFEANSVFLAFGHPRQRPMQYTS